jgi:von Willebrand factor A domain-containing protein 8
LYEAILKSALARFLPSTVRQSLDKVLQHHGIQKPTEKKELITVSNNLSFFKDKLLNPVKYEIAKDETGIPILRIGQTTHRIYQSTNPLLIPDILYHDNPQQTLILEQMLIDYTLGEHLLLIGNQGVGKNKLADRFLQLLRLPRQYIQLHRDTTVHSLTSTPTIVDGVLVYEDSPLVQAVREGYILIVDEADKAPTYVTSVLKTLVEDGEMVLSDGRRIVSRVSEKRMFDVLFLNIREFIFEK